MSRASPHLSPLSLSLSLPPSLASPGEIELVDPKTKKSRSRSELASLLELRELPRLVKDNVADSDDGYSYLLSMPLSSLTSENVTRLEAESEKAEAAATTMRGLTPVQIWLAELDALEGAIAKLPGLSKK